MLPRAVNRAMLALFLLALSPAWAWDVASFPNPMTDVDACGRRGKAGWVCDPDGFVSQESLDVLEGHIRSIREAKEPYVAFVCGEDKKGFEIGVAILKSVTGPGDAAERTEHFARGLHDSWGVGSCGGGALLVISVQDRQMYVSSGEAALKHLTTARVTGMRERMKPALRAGNYGAALEQAVVEMGLFLSEVHSEPEADPVGDSTGGDDRWLMGVVMSMAAGVWGIAWWRGRKEQQTFSSVKAKLQKMQQDLRDAKENKYLSTTCPICLDDFEAPRGRASLDRKEADVEAQPLLSDDAPGTSAAAASAGGQKHSEAAGPVVPDAATTVAQRGNDTQRVKAPFLLPCGHTFCEPCVMKWLESHSGCPVCRKPADGSAPPVVPPTRPTPPSTAARDDAQPLQRQSPSSAQCQPRHGVQYTDRPYLGRDLFAEEFAFRMMMMRRRYPTYITPAFEHDMVVQAAEGGDFNWVNHRDFLARNPELRAERAQQGASSSSMSFGGGGSAGGSGGSW